MAERLFETREQGIVDRFTLEDGKVWRERQNLAAPGILAENAELRRNPDALKPPDGMAWALQIPDDVYADLVRVDPELESHDGQVKHRAWQRFMRSDVSLPYRVYHAARGRTR
jgi:hypothetical protein